MAFISALQCRECGREQSADPVNVCDFCFGPMEVVYDYATISEVVSRDRIEAGPLSIWRYGDLLPADSDNPRGHHGRLHARCSRPTTWASGWA